MGSGRDLAQQMDPSPVHAQVLEDFKDQLMIVLLKRCANKNGDVQIPVAELDGTGCYIVSFKDELQTALRDLLQYLDDHDWGHVPEGLTSNHAREVLNRSL